MPDALALSPCYNPSPACAQLYLSPEHDKQGAGVSTPGRNTAELYSSLGRQRRSLHSTAATWSFSQTPVSGNACQYSPAAARKLLGSHTHDPASFQGVCLCGAAVAVLWCLQQSRARQLLCLIYIRHCSSGPRCNSHCSRLHSVSINSTSSIAAAALISQGAVSGCPLIAPGAAAIIKSCIASVSLSFAFGASP